MVPDGVQYLESWVSEDLSCCFQLMRSDEPGLLAEWMGNWSDLVNFDVYPVMSSREAAVRVDV